MLLKLILPLIYILCSAHLIFATDEHWNKNITYEQIIEKAKSGSPYYQGLLGIYLRSGEAGSAVNIDLSRKWSKVALSEGHPFGAYNLANLAMLEGDLATATTLYQDAALRLPRYASDGDPVAMYCMGEIDFQVIPTNVNKALKLFIQSAKLGYPQAQATIGALYLKGLPGLLERNTNQGIRFLSEAVRTKSLTARFNLGMAYYNGDGVEKNILKASQWLRLAVQQDFSEAQYSLGLLLMEGDDEISKNSLEGLDFLKLAALQNHQLAREYLRKKGYSLSKLSKEKNSSKSPLQTERAESETLVDEKQRLINARRFYAGVGAEQNYQKAYELFIPLARDGNAEAARFVGLMKLSGKGTEKNLKLAKDWLSVASQRGDKTALRLLDSYRSLF